MKTKLMLAALALATVFAGCGKDEEEVVVPPTKTELLTGKNWKVTACTIDPAYDWLGTGVSITDIYAQTPACTQDDIYTFYTDKHYTADEGATKCDPNDPQQFANAPWTFNSTETVLTLDTGAAATDYTIQQLEETTMKLREQFSENGVTYSIDYTFSKQ